MAIVTLADVAKRVDPNGQIPVIVEMLNETNEILADMDWQEGNLPTGHKTTVRTGLPESTWRMLNYGVQPTKSTTAQVVDTCGMLENYAEVDKDLAMLNGNTAAWRTSEDRAFLESMNQEMAKTLFYGDQSKYPAKFNGLAPRFGKISSDKTKAGYNIIDAGGTGSNNASIWFVTWGPTMAHGIYPKGSVAGFQRTDLGEVTLDDPQGGHYQGYRTHYQWKCGLTVRDWRGIVRIANIDVNNLAGSGAADLVTLLVKAYNRLGDARKQGRCVIYCNETIGTYLDLQAMNKSNVWLAMKEWQGQDVLSFRGIPIRRVDQLVDNEARVQ